MEKRILVLILFGGLMIYNITGCIRDAKKVADPFYYTFSNGDLQIVPLIKPYKIECVQGQESNWSMDFSDGYGTFNIKRIDVNDSIIYLLCGQIDSINSITFISGIGNVPTAWFILDTKKKKEVGFKTLVEFNNFLKSSHYGHPRWRNIDSLYTRLCNGGNQPWLDQISK